MDFLRHPDYFKRDEVEKNIPTMNQFVREVCTMLEGVVVQLLYVSARYLPNRTTATILCQLLHCKFQADDPHGSLAGVRQGDFIPTLNDLVHVEEVVIRLMSGLMPPAFGGCRWGWYSSVRNA